METEILETVYNPKKKRLNMKLEIVHQIYGKVLCTFYVKLRDGITVQLTGAYVEGMMIPLEQHKALLVEVQNNEELIEKVKAFSAEYIKNEPKIIEEKRIKKAGSLRNLSLNYIVVLSAKSVISKEIIRRGPKLSEKIEEEFQNHRMIIMVKFKELLEEYQFVVTYDIKNGYKVKVDNSKKNSNKLNIRDLFDEDACKGIVIALRRKLDFLP